MAQGQMKHLADQNGCLDGVIGIRLGSAALSCFCWSPLIDRRLRKPDRDVTALAQRIVVFWPIGHLVFWLGELVAAALAVFVRHWLFLRLEIVPHHASPAELRRDSDLCNNAPAYRS